MKGTEKIIAHIQADAKAQADAILAQAEQQCAEIRRDYEIKAKDAYAEKIRLGVKSNQDKLKKATEEILKDLDERVKFFEDCGKLLEAERLKQRVNYDVEMMREIGYCSGIENYSRYFDGRKPGDPPFTLLDYFPEDFVLFIDESHMTVPQIRAMYHGDLSRKTSLVDYGFRLPAAFDNRPLNFDEFNARIGQTVYVSATPAKYELSLAESRTSASKRGLNIFSFL